MNGNILGEEKITTLFLKYTIPAVSGMLFLGLNTIVDGFFVGIYIGVDALASVNIAMPFLSLLIALGVVIGIGTQSLVGKYLGENNIEAANDTFITALSLITGSSVLLAALALCFTKEMAGLLGANEHLLPMVTMYIYYTSWFLPFFAIMFVLDYVLKIMGNPFYSMMILVVAVIGHMLLNYLLIVQFGLGIEGSAFAMGISYMIAFALSLLPFLTGKTSLKLFQGSIKKSLAHQILYTGSSEGVAEIGTGVTTFLFNITLMRYVGEVGVAAFTAIGYLSFIGNNILIGLSDGVGAIISYNYGSGKMERVKEALKLACGSAVVIGIGLFAVISLYAQEIIQVFIESGNERVIAFAVYGAHLYALAFLVNGLNIIASGYFTAICHPQSSVLIALSKGIVWIGVGVLVLPQLFGIKGIWLTVPAAEVLTLFLSLVLLYRHFRPKFGA